MSATPVQLRNHPAAPCPWVTAFAVEVDRTPQALSIAYQLTGTLSQLLLPIENGGQRRDELWTSTCFEAFFRAPGSDQYNEFNFAPNGDWAAYQFDGYRNNMSNLDCTAPTIETRASSDTAIIRVTVPIELPSGPLLLGPTAILEDVDGARSFWAIHHALNKPDFHHIDTFKMTLE